MSGWFPNAAMMLAQTFVWSQVLTAFEARGSVLAHKINVCIRQDWGCRCRICHPEVAS